MSALSEALNAANVEDWSTREIARRSGNVINHATVANYLRGKHAARPTDEALRAFAVVFPKLSLQRLRELAGLPSGEPEPYQPPADADRLDARQRRAVDEIIRLLADPLGGEHGGDTAATSSADEVTTRRLRSKKDFQEIQSDAAWDDD